VSVLEVAWRTRPGGSGRHPRRFGDLVVDGVSLCDRLAEHGYDLISPLGGPPHDDPVRRRLRLEQPLLIESTWEPLMVCPECGEAACGAVVARIGARRGLVSWSDFGWYDGSVVTDAALDLGPLVFEFRAYRRALADPEVRRGGGWG
jgi:hypothetical protein